MESPFPLIGRNDELFQLQDSFLHEIIEEKGQKQSLSYLISGRQGIGKTRLVHEFLNSIQSDQRIALHIPRFQKAKHIIEYNCTKGTSRPYQPFIEIQKEIEVQHKTRRILKNLFMLSISWLPINLHDMIEDFEKLHDDISSGVSEDRKTELEIKTHGKFIKMLIRLSRKTPLFLYIQNIQWIDPSSLKLLQALIEGIQGQTIWGMIILELNDDKTYHSDISIELKRLIDSNKLRRLVLKPLEKGYETTIMGSAFRSGLFTSNEYDHMYTLSEGYPGLLKRYIDGWIDRGWLYIKHGQWEKVDGFESKIKPPIKKLMDLIIVFLQDGEISPREKELINSNAQEWDISEKVVTNMIDLILKCRELGYQVDKRVHTGSITQDAFLAYNSKGEKLVIEYIPDGKSLEKDVVPREINHPRLLPARDIIKSRDGILLVNNYYEGKTLREVREKADESHIQWTLQTAQQVAEGMAELHRNGFIHGYIRPETIIRNTEGEIQLTAIDAEALNVSDLMKSGDYLGYLSYCSPEKIDNKKIDFRSDIFSFGILFYEMLTGEKPFKGKTKGELNQAIRQAVLPPLDEIKPAIPKDIQRILERCLQRNPENRYQNTEELIQDLYEIVPRSMDDSKDQQPEVAAVSDEKKVIKIRKKRLQHSFLLTALILIIAVVVYIILKHISIPSPTPIVDDTVVIEEIKVINKSDNPPKLNSEIIEYLLIDDVLQSSDKNILTISEFTIRWPDKRPELTISCDVSITNFDYEVTANYKKPGERSTTLVYNFANPIDLLKPNGTIFNITLEILEMTDTVPERKISLFTENWDAFEKFYQGEKAWLRLDITYAEECLRSALTFDQDFILAKLRLAQVMTFNQYHLEAKQIIDEIQPHTGVLSQLDSLRTEALSARLRGDYFDEITILRTIQNLYPTRKECAYELAEAYYEICDVQNAQEYYKKALQLDPSFARAHNHLAYCYSHTGEHDIALSYFKKYLELDSTANAFDSFGDGFMAAGKLDSAEWAKKAGLELDPKLFYLWGSLGFINLRQGRYEAAERSFEQYLDLSTGDKTKAQGYFRMALIPYHSGNYKEALNKCLHAKSLYDTLDITTRDHDLHWLLGILYLKLNKPDSAQYEFDIMTDLITEHKIDRTNYLMRLYKSWLHLGAAIDAYHGKPEGVMKCIREFDGPLHDRIKDHSSVFDLAFFNTSLGELLLHEKIYDAEMAEMRFKEALKYNPNYALAHYHLWKLYEAENKNELAEQHLNHFRNIWENADPEVKQQHGV